MIDESMIETKELEEDRNGIAGLELTRKEQSRETNPAAQYLERLDVTERRRVEKELRSAEKKYRGIFENAIEGIFRTTPDGRILDANPALAIMYGYDSPEELTGMVSHIGEQLYNEHDTRRQWISSLDQQGYADFEVQMRKRDGSTFWVHQSVHAVRNSEGKTIYFEGFSEDITDRKWAEEALKQSECLYRAIFENTGTATIVLEEDTTISLANTEFEKLSGYGKEEIEGKKSWTEFIVQTDIKRMMQQHRLRRKDTNTALKQYEFRFIDRCGNIKDTTLRIDMIPGTKKSIASLLDITDRKRAEETLQESQRRLADIIEFFPDATLVIDSDRKVIAWNRAMEVLTGIKADDMLGRGHYEYALPFYGYRRPILVDLALNQDNKNVLEKLYVTPQSDRGVLWGEGFAKNLPAGDRYCSATATALHDSRGKSIAAIECVRDITEQKNIETRLIHAEKMESLGTLAGGVAHDLNNILGVLVGYSELLIEKLPDGSPLRRYAQHILKSSEKGAAIIQDLLTLARRGVNTSEVVTLNKVVTNYLDSPEYEKLKIYHPDIMVRTDLSADLFNIKGSPVHLGKTLMNLVSNAAEAISGVGIVTIKTENRHLDYATSGYDHLPEGNYVVLSVSDTGGGIPATEVGKIFEPFYTKKIMGRSGTGLGLAVVWGTVKDHHGYIDVKSTEGEGSLFTLYFPVTYEELKPEREKTDISHYMGWGESILVIDDMEAQRELAINLFSKLNYKIQAVSSGEAAIEYLKTCKVDLLLLDMIMAPGIDGLETFKRIREIEPKQKAIIVSGFAETERVRMAQELGAGEYIRKPFNIEKIGLAVRRELDRK